MGQALSCRQYEEVELFNAVQNGELEIVEAMAVEDPNLLTLKTAHGRLSALHVAAANGRIEVEFSLILLISFVTALPALVCGNFLL